MSSLLAIIVVVTARAQVSREAASSTAVQLPLSGRTSETGSVGTTQSVVNPGGTNSVNFINSSVNVQGPYFGSIPTGQATGLILPLSLEEAIRRGLEYNLGTFGFTQSIRQARGERYVVRSNLLPNFNANLREVVQQIDLRALGFPGGKIPGVPTIVGPFNYFDLRGTLTQTVADLTALRNYRAAGQIEKAAILSAKDAADQTSLRALAFKQNPAEPWAVTLNKPEWRTVEVASGSGHGNARGVARIYGAVGSGDGLDGVTLMSKRQLEAMITEQHHQTEALQDRPYHQALGVLLNTPEAVYMGPNMRSFGHHGIGGSLGFCDPDAQMGFSYACNKMHAVGTNGPRAARLIDALYRCEI